MNFIFNKSVSMRAKIFILFLCVSSFSFGADTEKDTITLLQEEFFAIEHQTHLNHEERLHMVEQEVKKAQESGNFFILEMLEGGVKADELYRLRTLLHNMTTSLVEQVHLCKKAYEDFLQGNEFEQLLLAVRILHQYIVDLIHAIRIQDVHSTALYHVLYRFIVHSFKEEAFCKEACVPQQAIVEWMAHLYADLHDANEQLLWWDELENIALDSALVMQLVHMLHTFWKKSYRVVPSLRYFAAALYSKVPFSEIVPQDMHSVLVKKEEDFTKKDREKGIYLTRIQEAGLGEHDLNMSVVYDFLDRTESKEAKVVVLGRAGWNLSTLEALSRNKEICDARTMRFEHPVTIIVPYISHATSESDIISNIITLTLRERLRLFTSAKDEIHILPVLIPSEEEKSSPIASLAACIGKGKNKIVISFAGIDPTYQTLGENIGFVDNTFLYEPYLPLMGAKLPHLSAESALESLVNQQVHGDSKDFWASLQSIPFLSARVDMQNTFTPAYSMIKMENALRLGVPLARIQALRFTHNFAFTVGWASLYAGIPDVPFMEQHSGFICLPHQGYAYFVYFTQDGRFPELRAVVP